MSDAARSSSAPRVLRVRLALGGRFLARQPVGGHDFQFDAVRGDVQVADDKLVLAVLLEQRDELLEEVAPAVAFLAVILAVREDEDDGGG
jgi:hypothetical protein